MLAALLVCAPAAWAQNENDPAPRDANVRIVFLPPPLEGTLSLGIYDKGGKLVRTLKHEAVAEKDFTVGLNGLSTAWDGKDDAGKPLAVGKYFARGFCVGQIGLSGEAILGNDWFDGEELSRIAWVVSLDGVRGENLLLTVRRADGSTAPLQCDRAGRLSARGPAHENVKENAALGKDGSIWTIDKGEAGPEVKQYSKDKEFIRRLAIDPRDPAPMQIASSQSEDVLYLLEEKDGVQRVRGLALETTAAAEGTSTWKMFLSKRIVATPEFTRIQPELGGAASFKAAEKLPVTLVPNPLLNDASPGAVLQLAIDANGSFLRTADGLRLTDLSDTRNLRWIVFGHEGGSRAVTFFQSDGAVVEQFQIRRPNNLMAFDAGEYELKR